MSALTAADLKPLPALGARIKLDYGPGNASTWRCAGVVIARVEGEAILVRRWFPHDRGHRYLAIDALDWHFRDYQVLGKGRKS